MLRPPYTRYHRIHLYQIEPATCIPEINDVDLIGSWKEDNITTVVFHKPKNGLIDAICRENGGSVVYQAELDYNDWEAGREFTTFRVGSLTIAPVWEPSVATDIRLDPSVIFGSGYHPTTSLCLEALLKYIHAVETNIKTLTDLGTGTGLLAIAAARQGVEHVLAVDHNTLACKVAQENAQLNKVSSQITVRKANLRKECPGTEADMVVANLDQNLLIGLFQQPLFWRSDIYILSGFLLSMEPALLAALPPNRIRFLERRQNERWCLWVIKRTAS